MDALDRIRIIDFTWVLTGPYATRILADYGAEVIKVQPLLEEEATVWAKGYYNNWNRNKLGISLNLGKPEGITIARRLIETGDVVVENFSPRVMANWGLDYVNLKEIKPDVIMVSISAMGQTGPLRNHVGFGPSIQAFSGLTYLTGLPEQPPSGLGTSLADHVAGLFATIAVLAALEHRHQTGEGQYVDISQMEAMCALLGPTIMDYTVNGRAAKPCGNSSHRAAPHGIYRCHGDDRWCAIAVFNDKEWRAFCNVLGNPSWCRQAQFATLADRLENARELDQLTEKWTKEHTAEEVMTLLQRAGVAAGVVQDASDLAHDPQLEDRGFFVQLDHPESGKITMDGTPMKLPSSPGSFRHAAPTPGQDNDYLLSQLLGLSEEEIAMYRRENVIC